MNFKTNETAQKFVFFLLTFLCISNLAGCAGPKKPTYQTKPQKFNWGQMYVWMAPVSVGDNNDAQGKGYLLINTSYKNGVKNKNCTLTVKQLHLKDSKRDVDLIEVNPIAKDGLPMTKKIGAYNTGQFHLADFPFDYDRSNFPYELSIDMILNCPDMKSTDKFSKKLEFRMEWPVIWMQ